MHELEAKNGETLDDLLPDLERERLEEVRVGVEGIKAWKFEAPDARETMTASKDILKG